MKIIKKLFLLVAFVSLKYILYSQSKDTTQGTLTKKFDDIIKAHAVIDRGLFNVYLQDGKYLFEVRNAILNQDILVVSRLSKGGADARDILGVFGYGGDEISNCVARFVKGPNNKIFIQRISYSVYSKDSTNQMYWAISNSTLQPIVAAFEIKTLSQDSAGCIIDMTDYLNGENDIFFIGANVKKALQIGGIQGDKSFINKINAYEHNIEIKTVKTFSKNLQPSIFGGLDGTSTVTLELNTSIVLLPSNIMKSRFVDKRVGYFNVSHTDYEKNSQGVERIAFIKRWRLEPKPDDLVKYERGELVEPDKSIIFYIDPATPKKWVPYLIQGVNDWQKAFEKAGFKNAIYAREAPSKEEDSTWSLEDSRYSAIVYKASAISNASGPSICDPRSGEILESHINWYHNIMELLHDWYLVQAGSYDPRARMPVFSVELMGRLIRFAISHEVGHSLGLTHNFGASSSVPVDSLRNKKWLEKNGHTPSIMDYARFNYVAQPEDSITDNGIFPRIGEYDDWAIDWGYRIYPNSESDEEKKFLNYLVGEKVKNKRLWFGSELNLIDPRTQFEDLGDDPIKASNYGIANLQRVLPNLENWVKITGDDYSGLSRIFHKILNQYELYINHVTRNIGGKYIDNKTMDQDGPVYSIVPKYKQKESIKFLAKNLLNAPEWLLNKNIITKIGEDPILLMSSLQNKYLNKLLSPQTLFNLISAETVDPINFYPIVEFFDDLKAGIWIEIKKHDPINVFRRNLQKQYITFLLQLSEFNTKDLGSPFQLPPGFKAESPINTGRLDISSIALAQLMDIYGNIETGRKFVRDKLTLYHLNDILKRIVDKLGIETK